MKTFIVILMIAVAAGIIFNMYRINKRANQFNSGAGGEGYEVKDPKQGADNNETT